MPLSTHRCWIWSRTLTALEAIGESSHAQRRGLAASYGVALGQTQARPHPSQQGENAGESGLSQASTKMLCRLLVSPGALSEADFHSALDHALRRVGEMDGKDCVRVLQALGQGQRDVLPTTPTNQIVLQELGARLCQRLEDVSLKDMAELAHSLARATLPALPVFARLSAAFSMRAAGAAPPLLTQVAVAFSTVRIADRNLFPRLGQVALGQLHLFSLQDLPHFLAAFAAVGICNEPLLLAAAKVIAARASKLSSVDLALVAYSYAQFHLAFPGVIAALRKFLPERLVELPPLRLAELVVSCSRLSIQEARFASDFARYIRLQGLSDPLFGQTAKALAFLGLASAPNIQAQFAAECAPRLKRQQQLSLYLNRGGALHVDGLAGNVGTRWVLDLLECLGDAAEDSRLRHGGSCPAFVGEALRSISLLLSGHAEDDIIGSDIVGRLDVRDVATVYRSLRQIPPSISGPDASGALAQVTSWLWPLHSTLAARAVVLVEAEAFSPPELTSVAYSQLSLFANIGHNTPRTKRVCSGTDDDRNVVYPRRLQLLSSWSSVSQAWRRVASDPDIALSLNLQGGANEATAAIAVPEMRTLPYQAACLHLHFECASSISSPLSIPSTRTHPAALELHATLAKLELRQFENQTLELRGPFLEGPVEVHSALLHGVGPTPPVAFCLLPEEAYFRRPPSAAAFAEPHQGAAPSSMSAADREAEGDERAAQEAARVIASTSDVNLELCNETAAELQLLRRLGYATVTLSCRAWRSLSTSGRRHWICAELLLCRQQAAGGVPCIVLKLHPVFVRLCSCNMPCDSCSQSLGGRVNFALQEYQWHFGGLQRVAARGCLHLRTLRTPVHKDTNGFGFSDCQSLKSLPWESKGERLSEYFQFAQEESDELRALFMHMKSPMHERAKDVGQVASLY